MMILVLFFIAALLQVSFFSYFAISGIVPDVILLVMILWLHRQSEKSHAILTFIAGGAMFDLLSGAPLGVTSISLLIVHWLARLLMNEGIKNKHNLFLFVVLICMTFILNSAQLIILQILQGSGFMEIVRALQYYFVNIFWIKSVYNIGLLFVILMMKRLFFTSPERKMRIGMMN